MRKSIYVVIALMILLSAVLCGCGPSEHTPTVPPPDYAQSTVESMLQALNNGDYASYSLYISNDLLKEVTPVLFDDMKTYVENEIGTYVSMTAYDVQIETNKTTVVYKATFTLADEVMVTAVFLTGGSTVIVDELSLASAQLEPDYGQAMTGALLTALTEKDYTSYVFLLSPQLGNTTTEEVFNSISGFYKTKIGSYISLEITNAKIEGQEVILTYKAKYSKVEKVTVTAIFVPYTGDVSVDGLYLYSPEMVEQ